MANKKISELDAATTAASTDYVPVVQGGVTKRLTLNLIPIPDATAAALAGKETAGAAAAAQTAAATDASNKAASAQTAATAAAATAAASASKSADTITDGTTNKAYTATEKTKLAGIAAGATVNRTDAATDNAIQTAVTNLVNGAPGALDQLNELAAALGNDANFAATMTAALARRLQVWAANRDYASGQVIVNPTGQLVTANTSFTSGTTYNAANWTQVYAITGTNTGDQTLSLNGSVLTIGGVNGNSVTIPTSGGATVSPATTTAQGIVQLAGDLGGTASAPTVPGLAAKAPLASPAFTGAPTIGGTNVAKTSDITAAAVGLGNVNNTSDANKPVSTAQQAALNAKADLVGGVVPTSQIPALALVNATQVASRAAMLALTTSQVQPGDVAVDTSTGSTRGTYMLVGADPSQITNWVLLNAPTDAVQSVNGQQGTVVLAKNDIGLGNVDNTADTAKPVSTAQSAALAAKKSLMTQQATQTASFTAVAGNFYPVNASTANVTVTLPVSTAGQEIQVKKLDANAATGATVGIVTVTGTINGTASASIPLRKQGMGKQYLADGNGGWTIVLGDLDLTQLGATTTEAGTLMLAGDLGGTASAPTVPGKATAMTVASVKTATYTAAANEIVPADATTTAFTVTLPTAPADKARVTVKKVDTGSNAITVATAGTDVLNKVGGSTSVALQLTNQAATFQYAATTAIWYLVGSDIPLTQLDARYPAAKVAAAQWSLSGDATTRQITAQAAPTFGPITDLGLAPVVIDQSATSQTVTGFGAALTDSSAYLMMTALTAAQRTAVLTEMFAPDQGNFSLVRVSLGSSDFTPTVYTLDDEPLGATDPTLADFSLSSDDLAYKIPLLRRIRAINPNVKILLCPWSPPAWMKTDPSQGITGTGSGNSLATTYLANYAQYFVKAIQAYQAVGIPIHAVTIQNEPENNTSGWPTCAVTSAVAITFIGTHLGPALIAAGLPAKIWAWDHNFSNPTYPTTVLANATAAQYVDAVAWHWYAGQPEDGMAPVGRAYPNVKQIVSEACGTSSLAPTVANFYRKLFIGAMRNGSTGVILWNILLDQNGGPCNHVYTPQLQGLYKIDTSTGVLTKNADLWSILATSRFVKPGAVRVASTSSLTGVQTVAYVNPDRSTVLVAFNSTAATVNTQVADTGTRQAFALALPAGEVSVTTWTGSVTGSVSPTIAAPAAPTLSAASVKGGVTLTIGTTAAADPIAGLYVTRGTTLIAVLPPGTTTWTDRTGTAGTSYTYSVYAVNGGGPGVTSAPATAAPTAATAATAPTNIGNTTTNITWNAPTDNGGTPVTGYNVYRGTTSNGQGATAIGTVPAARSGTSFTYRDTGAASGTTYYYKVTAVNAVGESPVSGEVSLVGGARAVATPTTATQPAVWLRSDALPAVTDGSSLSTWADSSGNGYNAVVPGTATAPLYYNSVTGLGPVVRFVNASGVASSAARRMASPYPVKGEDVTIFVVGKLNATTTQVMVEGATNDAKLTNSPNMYYSSTGGGVRFGATGVTAVANSSALTPTSPFIAVGSIETSANSHVFAATVNRQTSGTATPAAYTAATAGGISLGGTSDDFSTSYQFDVAELIVFPKKLSDADRQTWSAYLSQIYPTITVGTN